MAPLALIFNDHFSILKINFIQINFIKYTSKNNQTKLIGRLVWKTTAVNCTQHTNKIRELANKYTIANNICKK